MISKLFQGKILLCLILFLGLFLRIVWININPSSLYGDELTIALDANSLLKIGQDQLGNTFPLTFQMGAGRPAGYVYGSLPFIAIFGPSAIGVRALSILSGLGIIVLLFFIGRKLFSKEIGLTAAFIAALSPWDISLSRGGFEAHFALFLALLGIYLFIRAKDKPILYIFSALSFGLTLHTYPTYKVSLLFFLPLLFWYRGIKNIFEVGSRKYFFSVVILFLILALAALSQTFIAGSEKRFSDINILSREEIRSSIEQKIIFERNATTLPKIVKKYLHNKPVEYVKVFIENYLQNFSIDFLVIHGDRNPRHNMATMGSLYAVEIIFIVLGFLTLWQRQKKTLIFILLWIIIAPIPTAIVDLPHVLRSSFMLPPLIILSGLGLTIVLNHRNRLLVVGLGAIFIIQFIFFIQKLYFLAPNEYSNFWSYPAKIASELAIKERSKYEYVFVSDTIDSIEFAYPVYNNVDPKIIIYQNKNKTLVGDLPFRKYEHVYIGKIPNGDIQKVTSNLKGSILYIGTSQNKLRDYETIEVNGVKSLVIGRIVNE